MNKRLITILIVVMTLVLTGMVFIQIFWIKNAITLHEQQFDQGVNDALHKVSHKLEKHDAANYIFDEFFTASQGDHAQDRKIRLLQNKLSSSLENQFQPLFKEIEEYHSITWSGKFSSENELGSQLNSSMISIDTVQDKDGVFHSTIKVKMAEGDCKIQVSNKSREQMLQSVNQEITKLNYGKNLVDDIFFQFFSNEREIHDRIPKDEMGNIIREALQSEGIDAPFEFVVTTQFGKSIAASNRFNAQLIPASHKVTLFPNDLFSEHNYLLVQFPSKRNYIMKNLGVMSFSSIGLILLVSLCFAYTIHIIFRQKKLSDMKTDFVNNMTHELKTPISTISLASEMLRDNRVASDPDRILRYAGVIHEENKRLGSHVEKVLQMAVIERGEHKLKLSLVNLHELVQKAIQKMTLQLEEKSGALQTDFTARYPEAQVDEAHFINIITNLLDNAIKYSNEKPEIIVSTRDQTGGVLISVSDKGIGMSKDAQKRIFEKFYRVPTGNVHNVKGFGLGLSYVKAMVEAHSGNVKFRSELNKGTTFEIFIPHSNQTNEN
ncbi:MAG: HAMP domain-containing sensor histidine kinase [Chitinophagales bacterium]|nr:HAMP domain-containing sensor histidine kinase [Chitinophagales bacterium]